MLKSFKKLSVLLLGGALLAVSCATEGDIHKLNERIDALEAGKVATVEKQIIALQTADETLKTTLQGEIAKAKADLGVDIKALQDADKALGTKLDNAKTELQNSISAEKTAREQAITAAKQEATNAINAVNGEIAKLKTQDESFKTQIGNLGTQITNNFNTLDQAIKAAEAAAKEYAENKDKEQSQELEAKIGKVAKDLSDAVVEINSSIADYKSQLQTKIESLENADKKLDAAVKKLNEETIPGIEKQIKDLKDYADATFETAADFTAYKEATQKTIDAINDAIKNLADTKLDKTTFNEKVDEIIAKFDDYLTVKAFNEFKEIAATKAEVEAAKEAINARIDAVEKAYKEADEQLGKDIEAAEERAKKYADEQDMLVTAAFKAADDQLDEKYKGITDNLAARLDTAEGKIKDLEEQKELLWTEVKKALDAAEAVDTRLTNELKNLNEVVIPAAVVEAVEKAAEYTDAQIAEVQEEIDEIWDNLYFIQDLFDELDSRIGYIEDNILAIASRIQSITYVPDYEDMKVTMNVAYVQNGNAVLPVPQKTEITYKVLPVEMAEQIGEICEEYDEYYYEGASAYFLNDYFHFDVTDKLKTRSAESDEEGREIQIVGLKSYDPDYGYLTFEVYPLGIVSEGFLYNELTPIDGYTETFSWSTTIARIYQIGFDIPAKFKDVAGTVYTQGDEEGEVMFPVYDAEQLANYRERDNYAIALEWRYDDMASSWNAAASVIWFIDWENLELEEFIYNSASEYYTDYYYTPGANNSVSSCYNVLHPSKLDESTIITILEDPYINDPSDPRADAKGWVDIQDELYTLEYNVASDDENGTIVVLDGAQPLVEVDGEKYTYDELYSEVGVYLDSDPILESAEFSYDQNESLYEVDEDNFTEGTEAGDIYLWNGAEMYYDNYDFLTLSMNDDQSLAEKKKAVGDKVTGTYTWQPMVGDPFEWHGHILITRSKITGSATAHIDWTYSEDADVDHDRFYNRRDEEQYYYSREAVEVVFAEGFEDELAEKYGLTIADLFSETDPAVISADGASVYDGEETYNNSEAGADQAQFTEPTLGTDGKVYVGLNNFDFLPLDAQKQYIAKAIFSTSNLTLDMTLTVTTKDRDRTPMAFSFGETKVKLNDPACYDEDNDYFTAQSAGDKAKEILDKFIAQGIVTADDFANAAAFIDPQSGELRNSPIDKAPEENVEPTGADEDENWYDFYVDGKVFAATVEGNLDSETLQAVDGQKQSESRYSYIGQELQLDWTVSVDLPKYDFLHLEYYTWNVSEEKAGLITKRAATRDAGKYTDFQWWSQTYPSYLNGEEENGKPTSDRNCFQDYDVQYINLAELAFNVVDEDDEVMSEEDIEENKLKVTFGYTDETLAEKDLPSVDQIAGSYEKYKNLWIDDWTFYYRDAAHADIPVQGQLAIQSGNTDVYFPLVTRFQEPKNCQLEGYTDVSLDYSKYSVVRWRPFEALEYSDIVINLTENKVYMESLLQKVSLHDFRPGTVGTTYYVIKDGEWVIGNGLDAAEPNGYINGISAKDAYHIDANFSFDTSDLPNSLKKILTLVDTDNDGVEDTVRFDYTSETQFYGVVSCDVSIELKTPWQEPLKAAYKLWIKGEENEIPTEEPAAGDVQNNG